MKELLKNYKKTLLLWYLVLILSMGSLIFNVYQALKLSDNFYKLNTLIESKKELTLQIEELNRLKSQMWFEIMEEPLSIPITLKFEINSLSEALFNVKILYQEKGSLFKIENLSIGLCEPSENQTLKITCLYKLQLSGKKVKYLFER